MALGGLNSEGDLLNWLKRQFPVLTATAKTPKLSGIDFGNGTVTFTASGTSAATTVQHDLGVLPDSLGAFTNGGSANISMVTQNATATQFEVVGQLTNGATTTGTASFSWITLV